MTEHELTQDHLKELLDYDPETGVFRNRITRNSRAIQGEIIGTPYKAGRSKTKYVKIGIDKKEYGAHQLVWLYVHGYIPPKGWVVHHIDHDGTNNTLANLEEKTDRGNHQHRIEAHEGSAVPYLGVSKAVNKHRVTGEITSVNYKAQICHMGRDINLGTYKTPELARDAYLEAKGKLHDE